VQILSDFLFGGSPACLHQHRIQRLLERTAHDLPKRVPDPRLVDLDRIAKRLCILRHGGVLPVLVIGCVATSN
jgi:hypothetical protein